MVKEMGSGDNPDIDLPGQEHSIDQGRRAGDFGVSQAVGMDQIQRDHVDKINMSDPNQGS
jgi:hypothetical protein